MNARKPARKKAEEEQLLADALQAFEETVTTPATLNNIGRTNFQPRFWSSQVETSPHSGMVR